MSKAGEKYDRGKPPVARGVLQQFPDAVRAIAVLSAFGADKYTWEGWHQVPDGEQRYLDAAARHLLAHCKDPGSFDHESGAPHIIAAIWGLMASYQLGVRRVSDPSLPETDYVIGTIGGVLGVVGPFEPEGLPHHQSEGETQACPQDLPYPLEWQDPPEVGSSPPVQEQEVREPGPPRRTNKDGSPSRAQEAKRP